MKILLLALLSLPTFAATEILSTRTDTFSMPGSSLKEFGIVEYKKKFTMRGEPDAIANHMTDLRIILRTNTIQQISDYGVVQFIKGCQFNTEWDGSRVSTTFSISRDHFGKPITFRHREWEVDSDSTDPVYHSYEGDRFAIWRWNANPASLDPNTSKYLHFAQPPHPKVFFTDMPGSLSRSAVVYNGIQRATNSSLEFRVCVFKIDDLPTATDERGTNIDKSKALHCYDWSASHIYDFKTQRMTSPRGIDPRCNQ